MGMKNLSKKLKKYYRQHQKGIKRFVLPVLAAFLLFITGMFTQHIKQEYARPANIVWAIDETVQVPADLRKMLLEKDDCRNYRGVDSPRGVGLWAIVQVEQGRFAKIANGCSWSVSGQVLAVKPKGSWQLVPPIEYFSDTTQGVPTCNAVVKYKVPIALEGFCINDSGKLTKNPNPQ